METEIWKDIPEYEGIYQVSNFGNIRSLDRVIIRSNNKILTTKEKIKTQSIGNHGYKEVRLCKNCISKSYLVHRIVSCAFLNMKEKGSSVVVNHIDGNKINNNLENLEIVTQRYNSSIHQNKELTTSRFTGVSYVPKTKKWKARIRVNEKLKHIGYFEKEIDAYLAYKDYLQNL